MSVMMDNRLQEINSEEKVRKLQERIKKLEIQNEELRSELNKDSDNKSKEILGLSKCSIDSDLKEKLDLEKLPLEHIQHLSDEETWLFDSPKTRSHSKEWLRKDVDDPALSAVKKHLVNKLDEIANSPRHSPRHSLYSPSSSSGVLSPESPPSYKGEIDTRTFIRPKKRRSLALESKVERRSLLKEPNGIPSNRDHSQEKQRSNFQSNGSLGSEDEDRLSSTSEGSSYSSFRIADVEDVNTLARLQEESIRNSTERLSPPAGQLNRIRPPTSCSSGGSATSSQEDLLNNTSTVSQSSPRRVIPRGSLQPPRTYYSSSVNHHASREGSDLSTPPDSPYNSQNDLQSSNARSSNSRLPSLTRKLTKPESRFIDKQNSPSNSRGTSPLPANDSGRSHDARPLGRTMRLQAPQVKGSRLGAPSPARIPLGNPQMSELPRSKQAAEFPVAKSVSSLPKPGSRLQPPRSRPSESPSNHGGSDWREGCY